MLVEALLKMAFTDHDGLAPKADAGGSPVENGLYSPWQFGSKG